MRYPASEKLEIIRLVEGSHLSARLTLAKLGIPRWTFTPQAMTNGQAMQMAPANHALLYSRDTEKHKGHVRSKRLLAQILSALFIPRAGMVQ